MPFCRRSKEFPPLRSVNVYNLAEGCVFCVIGSNPVKLSLFAEKKLDEKQQLIFWNLRQS